MDLSKLYDEIRKFVSESRATDEEEQEKERERNREFKRRIEREIEKSKIKKESEKKIPCTMCGKEFKKETLEESGGICWRCLKKQITLKDKCARCGKEHNADVLKKRNGFCSTCETHLINTRKEKCSGCKKEFSHSTLAGRKGRCAACSYHFDLGSLERALFTQPSSNLNEYVTIVNPAPEKEPEKEPEKKGLQPIKFSRLVQESCSICLSDWNENDDIIILPTCKHYFHAKCINEWMKKKNICPCCNSAITE